MKNDGIEQVILKWTVNHSFIITGVCSDLQGQSAGQWRTSVKKEIQVIKLSLVFSLTGLVSHYKTRMFIMYIGKCIIFVVVINNGIPM